MWNQNSIQLFGFGSTQIQIGFSKKVCIWI